MTVPVTTPVVALVLAVGLPATGARLTPGAPAGAIVTATTALAVPP